MGTTARVVVSLIADSPSLRSWMYLRAASRSKRVRGIQDGPDRLACSVMRQWFHSIMSWLNQLANDASEGSNHG